MTLTEAKGNLKERLWHVDQWVSFLRNYFDVIYDKESSAILHCKFYATGMKIVNIFNDQSPFTNDLLNSNSTNQCWIEYHAVSYMLQ